MTQIIVKEYYSRDGSEFSKKDAAAIGPVLHEMSETQGVTARDVVDAARSKNSPLNSYFEWNDRKAADEHRLYQARSMLRSIYVEYVDAGGEEHRARAFQIQRTAPYENEARTYRTFQVLHGDSAFAAQMLGSAFDDLQTWKRKYEPYVGIWNNFGDAFQGVVNQIGEWAEASATSSIAVDTDDALVRLLAWREECADALKMWTECREQIEFVMEAVGDAEKVFAKVEHELSRPCIRCAKPFKSAHVGNRICPQCGKTQKLNSGVGEQQVEMVHGD